MQKAFLCGSATHEHSLILCLAQGEGFSKVDAHKIIIFRGEGSYILERVPDKLIQRDAGSWRHAERRYQHNKTNPHDCAALAGTPPCYTESFLDFTIDRQLPISHLVNAYIRVR